MENTIKQRYFSVELKSKVDLKNVTLSNGGHESVLVEGTIGELRQAEFADGAVLVIVGEKGTLRVNLTREEIKKEQKQEEEA